MATFVNEEGILHFPEMTHKQLEAMLTEDQRDVELWFCEFVPPELEHQSWATRHIGNREVYLQECVPRIFDLPEPRSPLERVMRSLFEDLGSTMKALPDRADAVVVDALADKFDRYTGPSISK